LRGMAFGLLPAQQSISGSLLIFSRKLQGRKTKRDQWERRARPISGDIAGCASCAGQPGRGC
jgi:hypothetical protein